MKTTNNLTATIGEPTHNVIVAGKYGDATLHQHGFVLCDPCYVPEICEGVSRAYRQLFPWAGYDYRAHRHLWHAFDFQGQVCWARDYSDGTGAWGLSVDSGWLVAIPLALMRPRVKDLFAQAEPIANYRYA
jgi:hypothetical protein